MGTRSRIGYEKENGEVVSSYCHWDGYPSGNGSTLLQHYTTLEQVKALVDEGDMSQLNEKCDKPEGHSFESPVEGYTVYYGRDRGEKNVRPRTDSDADVFVGDSEEYGYLFRDGKWLYSDHGAKLKRLTKAAIKKDS